MVKKTFIRILFICITSVLFNILYHVFFTEFKYTRNPPYILPDLELPILFIITFVLAFILEKYLLKSKVMWALAFGLFAAIIFHASATAIENKYSYLYEHYYKTTPYKSLIHLKKYEKLRDNRLSLKKALKNEGIKIESIQGGYTEKGHLANSPKDYRKKVYYVNDDWYIIFDWNERKITAQEDTQSIQQKIFMTSDKTPKDNDIRFSHSAYKVSMLDEHGMTTIKRYVIEPAEDGTFEFIQTH